jgi:hypothetical protein
MSKYEGHKHDVPSNFGRKFDRGTSCDKSKL